jgi:hypothetical protein
MKKAKTVFAALILLGNLAATGVAFADGQFIEKDRDNPQDYCHEKFRAIDPSTLDSDNPTLKSSDSADIIDFYGPCTETPTGKDQVWQQKLDERFWRDHR